MLSRSARVFVNNALVYFHLQPEFPRIVESKLLSPDADATPSVEYEYAQHDRIKHGLGRKLESLLNQPETPYSNCLSCYSYDKEIGKAESVVFEHRILQCSDYGN